MRKFIKFGIKIFGKDNFIKHVDEKYLKAKKYKLNLKNSLNPTTGLEHNILEYWIDCGKFYNPNKMEPLENDSFYERFICRYLDWVEGDLLFDDQKMSEVVFLKLTVSEIVFYKFMITLGVPIWNNIGMSHTV